MSLLGNSVILEHFPSVMCTPLLLIPSLIRKYFPLQHVYHRFQHLVKLLIQQPADIGRYNRSPTGI